MKKLVAIIAVMSYVFYSIFSIALAVNTDGKSGTWTREKAMHLAEITLFNPNREIIDALYAA